MRTFKIVFIFLLSFNNIINECYDDDYENIDPNASPSSCKQRSFSESEINAGAYRCCYVTSKCPNYYSGGTQETRECEYVTEYEYKNIDSVIKTAKQLGCSNVKIQCISSYLKLGLIYFLLIIL